MDKMAHELDAGEVLALAEDAHGFAAPLHVIHIRIHVIICNYKTFGM